MLIGLPVSISLGWLLAKSSMRGKSIIDALVTFPLVMPPVVTGYGLLLLLGRNGPIGGPLYNSFGLDLAFTWVAAVLAAALMALPLMVRAIEVAMAGVDHRLELASRNLGAGPIRTFFNVTVPLSYRGILAAVFLGFARGLGEFGATVIVAGNIPGRTQTLPLGIFHNIETGDDAAAVRLIMISLLLAVVSLLIHQRIARRRAF
jgi:molybdate transport system permease protein